MTQSYPRAAGLPKPGFASGPCLMKDTVQLVSFAQNKFLLGTAAVMTNEGMAEYVISEIQKDVNLSELTVGLLGMSFKPEIDDTRSSLSFRILKLLEIRSLNVICNDPFVIDQSNLHPIEYLKNNCDVLIICTPHEIYRESLLDFQKPIVDIWGFLSDNTNLKAQLIK
jgi:UDP-N-acetyl-D-mannosaminuronic acid dehydrogenase